MKRNTILIIGAIALVAVLLCAVLFIGWLAAREGSIATWQPRLDRDRHHWDMPMWEPIAGPRVWPVVLGVLGLLSCLLLVGALALGALLLANRRAQSPPVPGAPIELDLLRGRYARGEMSREEYLARREELRRQN
jgi:uncharacterized membrane protein